MMMEHNSRNVILERWWSVVAMWGSSRNQDVTDLKTRVMLRRCDFHSRTTLLYIRWFANIVRCNSKQQSMITAMYILTGKSRAYSYIEPYFTTPINFRFGSSRIYEPPWVQRGEKDSDRYIMTRKETY